MVQSDWLIIDLSEIMVNNVPEIGDDEALTKAASGDQQAFGLLYERYVGRIYTYIFYRTGNSFDAEDLTARVFLRASASISRYRIMGVPFSAWLYRIAHNLVANWHRDINRHQELPLEDHIQLHQRIEPLESSLMKDQEMESLLKVIRKMPDERQQLIILKFVEHLSNAEIGEIMNRSEGAIKSLYHRTLLALRDALDQTDLVEG